MKQYQNTLFVITQGAWLRREGQTLLVQVQKEVRLRVPIHTIAGVICFGRVLCSPSAMELCGRSGVPISWLTERGRFIARAEGPISGNVLLRREQYRRADDLAASASIARAVVAAKIANSRTVLQRALRDHPDFSNAPQIEQAVQGLRIHLTELDKAPPLDQVRGVEGESARCYFGVFNHLITAQKDEFFYMGRSRRPPLDNMNALLSFLYTLLAHDVAAALQSVGLDPAVGFLHRDRPGRPGLALDLMEEMRAFLADRLALSLVNLRQVQGPGFRASESGAVWMDDATRKEVLQAWQKRKQEEIQHPFLGERMTIALMLPTQALLLARHLRGDLDAYPPFIWK
jgi:CRISPR-associated protein Cas1